MTSSDETELQPDVDERVAPLVDLVLHGDISPNAVASARVAVVCAEFNGGITERLLHGVLSGLSDGGVKPESIEVAWVPGAFELPLAAKRLALQPAVKAVIALGAVIRGDTAHFDFVAGQCAEGLLRVSLDTSVPVVFGVLTTDNVEQALVRSLPDETNKGRESAVTALRMLQLLDHIGDHGPR
jgi:6,7-dimethyl-8-ribityllumazine synthase